jgi:hypothetical protein
MKHDVNGISNGVNSLRDCLYNTIHRNKKPLKVIAEELGMSETYLTRSALPDAEDSDTGTGCRFPLKKLISLIKATNDFSILDFIEQSLGRVAVNLPKSAADINDIYRLTMISVREYGHLMSKIENSVADGKVTPQETEKILKEGYDAVQAIMALIKTIEQAGK